jgi:hypothetical protein
MEFTRNIRTLSDLSTVMPMVQFANTCWIVAVKLWIKWLLLTPKIVARLVLYQTTHFDDFRPTVSAGYRVKINHPRGYQNGGSA